MPFDSQFAAKPAYQSISDAAPRAPVRMAQYDLSKIVVIDFESFWDKDYTLKKMSTSEYIRDERFEAQMMGIKIGTARSKVVKPTDIKSVLSTIDWSTHGVLAHNTAFDGLILSHHYGVVPRFYLDTLSMARGLHSNDIGAGLDEVARFYGVGNKLVGALDEAKGKRHLPAKLYRRMAAYCKQDVELTIAIFKLMAKNFPHDELLLVDQIVRMFCDPVLTIDRPRVEAEHAKELARKKALILSVLSEADRAVGTEDEQIAKGKKVIGSRDGYVALLRAEGIEPPTKLSPTTGEVTYAFAKTDVEFTALLEHPNQRVADLVEARLGVKSSISETRAVRFLNATANSCRLPVGYAYYRAHTGRLGGANKMNMQNLNRGGELRRSIYAPKGYVIPVADSSQIEVRVNGWLWGQDDLLDEFKTGDPYCAFGSLIYERPITKKDVVERFVAKTCVLALGYQTGAAKLQATLAIGGSGGAGPKVFLDLTRCQEIVAAYRKKNHRIRWGWDFCAKTIIHDMATGRQGSWKCLHWEKEKIWLPNGMCLKYPGLRMISDPESTYEEWQYMSKGAPKKIYGGLLDENLCQALARIIVTGQLLEISHKNRVVMMTHDEVAALARKAAGAAALARMLKIMRTPPPWCADIPLNAEGSCEAFYSK